MTVRRPSNSGVQGEGYAWAPNAEDLVTSGLTLPPLPPLLGLVVLQLLELSPPQVRGPLLSLLPAPLTLLPKEVSSFATDERLSPYCTASRAHRRPTTGNCSTKDPFMLNNDNNNNKCPLHIILQ